jgi:hypothetical protein
MAVEVVEEADAVAEQRRDEGHADLVQQARLEELLRDVGGHERDVPVAGDGLRLRQGALDAIGDDGPSVPGPTHWSGGLWVSRKNGPHSGWWPPQPLARSNVRRPAMTAPTSSISATTSRLRAGGLTIPSGPKPSVPTDIQAKSRPPPSPSPLPGRSEPTPEGRNVFVLASQRPAGTPDHVVTDGDPARLLDKLRAADQGRDVHLIGGPRTIETFRAMGALDKLELVVLPILLGDGMRLTSSLSPTPG